MGTWGVTATRSLSSEFTIEAASRNEANELAREMVLDKYACSDWEDYEDEITINDMTGD